MTIKQKKWTKLFYWFGFERLIAPLLIKLIYGAGVVAILVAGVAAFFHSGGAPGGIGRMLLTLLALALSLLLWRVISELWILAFNMYARLLEIRDLLSSQQQALTRAQPTMQPPSRDGE